LGYFQLFLEVSTCPRGPKSVLFHLAKFLLEALDTLHIFSHMYLHIIGTTSWFKLCQWRWSYQV